MHPGTARRRDDDHRQVLVHRELDRAHELLADDRAHAAAEEPELEDGEDGRLSADRRDAADHRLVRRGLLDGGPNALPIFLGVLEAERIGRRQTRVALFEGAGIGELPDTLARGDPEGIVAFRADASGPLHLGAVHDLLAGVALDPEAFGDDDLGRLAPGLLTLALEPGH